jgi:hypothetical protein
VTLSDRRCFECDRTLGDCALSVIVVLKGALVSQLWFALSNGRGLK